MTPPKPSSALYTTRSKPNSGVRIDVGQRTIVFVTACTKDRQPWLACAEAHNLLKRVWTEADAWLVSDYVLMPDHLHFFASPRNLQFTIERWITFWKSQFSKAHSHANWSWQTSVFHHRLRDDENYSEKWGYVRENPIRAGLAENLDEWPFQGTIHPLQH